MKYLFSILVAIWIFPNIYSVAHAEFPKLRKNIEIGYWSRNSDGSFYVLHSEQASHECARRGQHLPTIREMVEIAVSKGATGIVLNWVPGFTFAIHGENVDGTVDSFYYDWRGHSWPEVIRPDGSSLRFLTSTKAIGWPRESYAMHGQSGQMYRTDATAFFCIK